jgi:hypothetical protein
MINSLVGCFGITKTKIEKMKMTLDKWEASRQIIKDNVFVSNDIFENGTTLYKIIEELVNIKDDSYLPIYNQIVACEAVALHKLEKLILANGGVVLDRNTDAIRYIEDKHIDISGYKYADNSSVYQYENNIKPLNRDAVCKFVRYEKFVIKQFIYNDVEEVDNFDKLSDDIVSSGKGIFIIWTGWNREDIFD